MGKDEVHISHLQFANNTLVMCEGHLNYVKTVKNFLQGFQAVSGFKVNYQKIQLLAFELNDSWKQEGTALLGCSLIEIPFKYLGFPPGILIKRVSS